MTRREAREQAFILVFEQAIRGEPMDAILHDAAEARDLVPSAFAEQEALGVEAHREEIDSVIEQHIRGWSLRRLSKVALALQRLAVYEMKWEDSIDVYKRQAGRPSGTSTPAPRRPPPGPRQGTWCTRCSSPPRAPSPIGRRAPSLPPSPSRLGKRGTPSW